MSNMKKLTEGEGGEGEGEGGGQSVLNYNTTKLLKKLDSLKIKKIHNIDSTVFFPPV